MRACVPGGAKERRGAPGSAALGRRSELDAWQALRVAWHLQRALHLTCACAAPSSAGALQVVPGLASRRPLHLRRARRVQCVERRTRVYGAVEGRHKQGTCGGDLLSRSTAAALLLELFATQWEELREALTVQMDVPRSKAAPQRVE